MDLAKHTILEGADAKYIVARRIDNGGVGTVFEAQRATDKVHVAVKVLHGGRLPITDTARERFRREIAVAMRLPEHPSVVKCLDFGEYDGDAFLVMEYLTGGTVGQRIKKKDYSDAVAFRWCKQLIDGVLFLHSQGCIHRDLKPNNLLLTASGDLQIGDLGIVRDSSSDAYLTLAGDQIGSVLYISMHQRECPDEADEDDDAFSVCCCMYEILTRRRIHPFGERFVELVGSMLPAFVTDLVTQGLVGAKKKEALLLLSQCFELSGGDAGIAPLASSVGLNKCVVVPAVADSGSVRWNTLRNLPLHPVGIEEYRVPPKEGMYDACFIGDDLFLVSSYKKVHLIRFADGRFSCIQSLPTKCTDARLASNGEYVVGLSYDGFTAWRVNGEVLAPIRSARGLTRHLLAPDMSRVSIHPTLGLVALSFAQAHPQLLELDTGATHVLDRLSSGSLVQFAGESRLVSWGGRFVSAYCFEVDTKSYRVALVSTFSHLDPTQVASRSDGSWVVAVCKGGLKTLSLDDGSVGSSGLPSGIPTQLPKTLVLHPTRHQLALRLGDREWLVGGEKREPLWARLDAGWAINGLAWSPSGHCLLRHDSWSLGLLEPYSAGSTSGS